MNERGLERAAVAGINAAPTEAAIQLMEEVRMRDQSGDSSLVVNVSLDSTRTVYMQESSEPKRRWRNPRTRGPRAPGVKNSVTGILRAKADFYQRSFSEISDAIVGTTYSGEEIGLPPGQYMELIRFNQGTASTLRRGAIAGGRVREDFYVPVTAIKEFTLQVVPQE